MGRKRKRGRPRKDFKEKYRRKKDQGFIFEEKVNPETFWGVVLVLCAVLGLIIILSLFNLAGSLGGVLKQALKIVFGKTAYLVPLVCFWFAALLYKKQRAKEDEPFEIKKASFLGVGLIFLSLAGLFHFLIAEGKYLTAAQKGLGGGHLGYLVIFPLEKVVGLWAGLIILLAFLVIGVILMFNTSPGAIAELLLQFKNFCLKIYDKITRRQAIREAGLRVKGLNDTDEEDAEEFAAAERKEAILAEKDQSAPDLTTLAGKTAGTVDEAAVKVSKDTGFSPFSLDLLDNRQSKPTSGDIRTNARVIEETLKSFAIEVSMEEVNIGPTVTQYTFKPKSGVKLSQITTLQNDLSLALAAHPLRIEAPIPGRSLVGVEIPNRKVALVRLREVLASKDFKGLAQDLKIALGRNVAGDAVITSLVKMPHLLIAGATGSGKSVAIHSLIVSLLYAHSPRELRIILVDPKKVELTCYNGVPHLLTPVITEVEKTINSLRWAVSEMERRFLLLSESGRRDIASYNKAFPDERLPYIVMIIDELADLMATAAGDVEAAVVRLAQMSRAVGIHLVLATQRPSVNVITGLIKANITARIAFTVASQIDSRTIIDSSGAEKLLGNGDMLYVASELGKPRRVQGSFVSENEVKRVVDSLKSQGEVDYNEEVIVKRTASGLLGQKGSLEGDDDLFDDAKEVVVQAGKASASLLQRRLKVGYARAARLLDCLEERGIIGPPDGAKPREVYLQPENENPLANDGA